ncbi:MAG: rRNA maturation RNase YbeY [Dehalococcoidia bacterium]
MPSPRYAVALHVEPRYAARVRSRTLAALARRVLAAEGAETGSALSIVVTDDATVRDLNKRFLGIDEPTDVLSFGLSAKTRFVTSSAAERQLGEVVISFPTAQLQARQAGHPLDDELAHLLVHGMLHILGYDHQRPAQARLMRAREDELLRRSAH